MGPIQLCKSSGVPFRVQSTVRETQWPNCSKSGRAECVRSVLAEEVVICSSGWVAEKTGKHLPHSFGGPRFLLPKTQKHRTKFHPDPQSPGTESICTCPSTQHTTHSTVVTVQEARCIPLRMEMSGSSFWTNRLKLSRKSRQGTADQWCNNRHGSRQGWIDAKCKLQLCYLLLRGLCTLHWILFLATSCGAMQIMALRTGNT